jgi:hypothetical protein
MQSMNVLPFEDRAAEMRPAGVRPEFYSDAVLDQGATAAAGRPIYRDVEFVKIIVPGVVTNVHVKIVGPAEKARWPREYEAFRVGLEQPVEGTPIEEWPILTRAMVKELKHFEIRTVEELSVISDVAVQNIGMGGRDLRAQAKAYLSEAERLKLNTQLTRDNELLTSRIASLEAQVGQLGELLTRIDAERRVLADRPNPLAVAVPAHFDPMAMAVPVQGAPPTSALDAMANRRRSRRAPEADEAPLRSDDGELPRGPDGRFLPPAPPAAA